MLTILVTIVVFLASLGALDQAHAGDLLVSSQNTDQILRYNGTTGAFVGAFVGAGSGGLSAPAGLAFGADAELYAASADTDSLLRYDGATGASIDAFASTALAAPSGLAFGPDGHLYVSSGADHRVVRYHYIGRDNPRIRVVNNLIRDNGRNGVFVECGVQNAPKYFVNNTVVRNGFNGLFIGDAKKDEAFLINLIVGNGTAPGVTGGRFGILRESAAPAAGPGYRATIYLRNNVFYRNRAGDIGNVVQTLDAADSGNLTTTGAEAASCYPSAAGCPGAIAGCTFAGCSATHPLDEIFIDPAAGDFRLIAGSPAVGAGLASFVNGGAKRVPASDFEGNPRPVGAPVDAGFHETP